MTAPAPLGAPLTGPDAPPENVQRGVALSLVVVPLGIVAWDLLWQVGFIASFVAFGVALGAMALYRMGSGGVLRRPGAIAVTVVTIATLLLAFVSGFAVDIVPQFAEIRGLSIPEALVQPEFWSIVFRAMAEPQSSVSLLLAVAFGFIGCFRTLRGAFRQTRPASGVPGAPQADPYPQQAGPMGPFGQQSQPGPYGEQAPRLTQDDDPRA